MIARLKRIGAAACLGGLLILLIGTVLCIQIAPIYYTWKHSATIIGFAAKAILIEAILFGLVFTAGSVIVKLKNH